jgi:DNA-binding SARP family transcriptional activator
MSSEPPARISLWLLNGFDLRQDNSSLQVPAPAQRLLAYLALQDRPVLRRAVAAALWADTGDQQASARLRSTLWRLPSPGGQRLVEADGGRLRLAGGVDVDVRIVADDDRVAELDVTHLCGDVLADWAEDWVAVERERVRQLRLHRLEQLSEWARRQGRHSVALQAALAAVAVAALRESAHRQVMRVHLVEQNPSEALRQYDLVRRLLRDELGLAPSPATRALVADILGRPLDRHPADIGWPAGDARARVPA